MRVNLPVTVQEYPLPQGAALVSRTDLKGRITYVNPTFVEVSGYTLDELMGKAHNIVRHPDINRLDSLIFPVIFLPFSHSMI